MSVHILNPWEGTNMLNIILALIAAAVDRLATNHNRTVLIG